MFARIGKELRRFLGRPAAPAKGSAREQALAAVRAAQPKVMTPERAELLKRAMEVHRAKQAILADIDDVQKQRLVAMALRAFLNEGREETTGDSGSPSTGKSASGKAAAGKGSRRDSAGKGNGRDSATGAPAKTPASSGQKGKKNQASDGSTPPAKGASSGKGAQAPAKKGFFSGKKTAGKA